MLMYSIECQGSGPGRQSNQAQPVNGVEIQHTVLFFFFLAPRLRTAPCPPAIVGPRAGGKAGKQGKARRAASSRPAATAVFAARTSHPTTAHPSQHAEPAAARWRTRTRPARPLGPPPFPHLQLPNCLRAGGAAGRAWAPRTAASRLAQNRFVGGAVHRGP